MVLVMRWGMPEMALYVNLKIGECHYGNVFFVKKLYTLYLILLSI